MSDMLPIIAADIECGSIGKAQVLNASTGTIEVQSSREFGAEGSLETWICGRVTGATGDFEIVVTNEHGNMQFLRPVISVDGLEWEHVTLFGPRLSSKSTEFRFTIPARGADSIQFATWWPYPYRRAKALAKELASLPYVSEEVIGLSVEGRPIQALMISEGSPTRTVAITSGMHGAETSAMHATEGAIRYLCSSAGASLRCSTRFVIVPMINVDAQAAGLDRRNAAGVNLFLDDEARDQPELIATFDWLRAKKPDAYLDLHSWHWGGDGCYVPGWLTVGDDLYSRVLALRGSVDAVFPLGHQIFFDEQPTNWLTRTCVELQCPVMCCEITLSRGTDGAWKTLDRSIQDGVAIVRAASRYVHS